VVAVTATAGPPETGWGDGWGEGWTGVPPAPPNAIVRWRRRNPWGAPALVGAVVGLGTAYTAWQDPNRSGGLFPGCPLREMTGLDCPGCGGTRALHALTHGDLGAALDHNAVISVLLPLLLVAWALWLAHSVRLTRALRREEAPPSWPAALRPRIGHRTWMGLIVALVAFAVLRNISAVPVFDYLGSEA
jgi:hypothetical protein